MEIELSKPLILHANTAKTYNSSSNVSIQQSNLKSLCQDIFPLIAENLDTMSGRSLASTNTLINRLCDNCEYHKSWKRRILSQRYHILFNNTGLTINDLLHFHILSNVKIIGDKIINSCKDMAPGIMHIIEHNKSDHTDIIQFCKQNPSINLAIGIDVQFNIPFISLRLSPLKITSDGYIFLQWPMKIKYSRHHQYVMVIQFVKNQQVNAILYVWDARNIDSSLSLYPFVMMKIKRYRKLMLFEFIEELIKKGQAKYYNNVWVLEDNKEPNNHRNVLEVIRWILFGYGCIGVTILSLIILLLWIIGRN